MAKAEIGYNSEFNSWWIPDVALDACPLLAAVRALYVSVSLSVNMICMCAQIYVCV